MQPVCWAVTRAFTKLGIAIAAKRPIMATTIMISTNVNPPFRDVPLFILAFLCYGVNKAAGGLFINTILFTYCRLLTVVEAYQKWASRGNLVFSQSLPKSTGFSHPLF